LPPTVIYPSPGAPPSDYIAQLLECDALGCLKVNSKNNPDNLVATHVESKNIQCGIRKKSMNTYKVNVVEEENTTWCF
jgi:hypothetical protein